MKDFTISGLNGDEVEITVRRVGLSATGGGDKASDEWTTMRVLHLSKASEIEAVVQTMNSLPAYEAAVEALKRLLLTLPNPVPPEMKETATAGFDALRRLYDKVPA